VADAGLKPDCFGGMVVLGRAGLVLLAALMVLAVLVPKEGGRDGLAVLLLAPDCCTGRGGLKGGGLRFAAGSGDLMGGMMEYQTVDYRLLCLRRRRSGRVWL